MKIDKEAVYQFLKDHDNFLLFGHIHPDGDDIGSICALHNMLVGMGKKATMVIGDDVPERLAFTKTAKLIHKDIPEGEYGAMIFTDLANLARGGDFDFPKIPSLCIDHHISNEEYTDFLYLRADYAATAELLAEIAFDHDIPLDEDAVNGLYLGLGTDSGFFKFSCTSAHTLLMASKLVEAGANPAFISNHLDVTTKAGMEGTRAFFPRSTMRRTARSALR